MIKLRSVWDIEVGSVFCPKVYCYFFSCHSADIISLSRVSLDVPSSGGAHGMIIFDFRLSYTASFVKGLFHLKKIPFHTWVYQYYRSDSIFHRPMCKRYKNGNIYTDGLCTSVLYRSSCIFNTVLFLKNSLHCLCVFLTQRTYILLVLYLSLRASTRLFLLRIDHSTFHTHLNNSDQPKTNQKLK